MANAPILAGSYDYRLVALSVLIATLASYASFDFAGRIRVARGRLRFAWLTGGAMSMGLGIWSMHYVGMLAYSLPVTVRYDWPTVLISLVAAMCASGVALFVVSRDRIRLAGYGFGGIAMGGGIAAMHYIGMDAMRLSAMCVYSPGIVILSVILAVFVSLAALWLTFHLRGENASPGWHKPASALLMGAGIPAMHYTGMAAVRFVSTDSVPDLSHSLEPSALGIAAIIIVTLMVLGLAILTSVVDRRFSALTQAGIDQLARSEARYRSFIELAVDAILVVGADGTIQEVNRQASILTGLAREQLVGTPMAAIVSEAEAEQIPGFLDLVSRGVPVMRSCEIRRPESASVAVEIHAVKLHDGPVLCFCRDTTERFRAEEERKQLQAQLIQAQKMESIGRLAGGIAHDFNNLLTVINGYAQILAAKPDSPKRRTYAEQIQRAGDLAANLTRQLLLFSRNEKSEPELVRVNTIVAESGDMLKRLVGVDVEMRMISQASPDQVLADPNQIHQCLMNLVVNACDAMPAGGQLTIETANVHLTEACIPTGSTATSGRYVCLTVWDTGTGMDPRTRERMFEPFFSTKGQGRGTGLGLSVVYGIVTQWRGFLKVSSELGLGSEFRLYLPANETFDVRGHASPGANGAPPDMFGTVLVVDDQDMVRGFVAELLRTLGYTVFEASNGMDALQKIEREGAGIDLVITDIMMPGMRGGDLARRARTIVPSMKILFMTGYSDGSAGVGDSAEGAHEVIGKPIDSEVLAERVQALIVRN